MKTALRHILCGIFLFLLASGLYGQPKMVTKPEMDERLNRYELLCKECLDLKALVSEGRQVSRTHASGMISKFVAMNREIKADSICLNPLQQSRFKMINHWFTTGNRPLAMDHVPIRRDMPELTGEAVGMMIISVPSSSRKHIGEHFDNTETEQYGQTEHKSMNFYVMAEFSLPVTYGLMAGLKKDRLSYGKEIGWGGYMRLRSNFIFRKSAYSCLSNGTIGNGYAFLGNGNMQKSDLMVTAGVLAGLAPWLDIYAGAGYGQKIILWQDIEDSWASVSDFTHKGLALEAGLITSWRRLCLGIGISTVNFRTASLDLSVGMRF